MIDGKISLAPCGHPGVHVVGDYVHCPLCDALPNRDQIDPARHVLCSRCRTLDVVKPRRSRCATVTALAAFTALAAVVAAIKSALADI